MAKNSLKEIFHFMKIFRNLLTQNDSNENIPIMQNNEINFQGLGFDLSYEIQYHLGLSFQ